LATPFGKLAGIINTSKPDLNSKDFVNFPKVFIRWMGTVVRVPARITQLGLNIIGDTFAGLRRLNRKWAYEKTSKTRKALLMKEEKSDSKDKK
jgi:hypothetical protein